MSFPFLRAEDARRRADSAVHRETLRVLRRLSDEIEAVLEHAATSVTFHVGTMPTDVLEEVTAFLHSLGYQTTRVTGDAREDDALLVQW
jgi:hypothetical protein